ncbi:MAG: biotin transporter BioY, partial [Oscillospiraceae bacterium]|nr:biotin transporter BioY [Oscillospiraceae bacterium]
MSRKRKLQKLLLTALFTALTAAGALLHIDVASLQTMFACLAGLLLGPVWGPVSQALYVFLGLLGLPIFVGGGGFAYVLKPFFGFLPGLILCAFVTGVLSKKTQWNIWLITTLGLLSVYLIGTPYFYFIWRAQTEEMNAWIAIAASCLVYLPLDFA